MQRIERTINLIMIIWLLTAVLITAADQLIKYLVIENIALTDTIEAIPGLLNFIYVKNTGAAFSILSDKTGLLSVISIAVCVFVIFYLVKYKPKNKLYLVSLGMILGGAAGNMIDRVFRHFVVDYIELVFINFPVFNLADIGITVGAVLLMIYVIFFDNSGKKE